MQRSVAASGLATVVFVTLAAMASWYFTSIGQSGPQITSGESAALVRMYGQGK